MMARRTIRQAQGEARLVHTLPPILVLSLSKDAAHHENLTPGGLVPSLSMDEAKA
jgi:hypothetical protein